MQPYPGGLNGRRKHNVSKFGQGNIGQVVRHNS